MVGIKRLFILRHVKASGPVHLVDSLKELFFVIPINFLHPALFTDTFLLRPRYL